MKTLQFQNGDTIPIMGLGTWLSKKNELYRAILDAIRIGYRHIDCAYIYENEAEVGRALQEAFSLGLVKREELFITSKLWNSYHAPENVEAAFQKSLNALQLDYLDLYLMHWPIAFRQGTDIAQKADDLVSLSELPLSATWGAMQNLKSKKTVKHLGVSNFNIPKIKQLIADTGISPELNQVELHPYLQQAELVSFCQNQNILLTAYSPLGGRRYVGSEHGIEKETIIVEIAKKHNCQATQVLLAWGMQRNTIVIPKSTNKERIKNNFDATHIELDKEDMQRIEKLNCDLRICSAKFAVLPDGCYDMKGIWES